MKYLYHVLVLAILVSCQQQNSFQIDEDYRERYQEYRAEKKEEQAYYLSISDMFELDPADSNSFGSASENSFQLKDSTAPARIGSIEFEKDSLVFRAAADLEVRLENDSVVDEYNLISLDHRGHSEVLQHKNYSWYVNSLENVKLLRIMNSENPEISKFPGFQAYELTPEFIFEGKLTYYDSPKIIEIPVTQGGTREGEFIGSIEFEYNGQAYELEFMEGNFIMFGDKTALTETYGAGRYLEFEATDEKTALLDFNRAYNPPCSYSGFTTCSYPPEENWLEFAVKAGEKEALTKNE